MKKFVKSLFLLTFLSPTSIFCQFASAQEMNPADETQMMLRVVDLLEEYERYAGIDEDFSDYGSSFRALFVSGQAPVYNDLLGVATGKTLTVKDYVSAMSSRSSTTRVEIKNIDKKSVTHDGDIWKVICTFDKYINLTNTCGIEYASDYFNATDYKLTATIDYNPEENTCLFEKIDGTVEPVLVLGDDYRVFKSESSRDKDVLYAGKRIEFNAMGQAFVEGNGSFVYKDPDVALKVIEEDPGCHLWRLTYKPKPFRVKFHYDIGLGGTYALTGADNLADKRSSGSSFGLDLGYVFPSKSKFKVGIFIGFGMSQSDLDLSFESSDYAYQTNADVDGDSYIRHYSNLSVKQTEKINDMNIPVYFDFDLHFSKLVSMYLDLGSKLNMNMSHKLGTLEGHASEIYGIYPKYGNLRLDYNWNMNGFADDYNFADNGVSADLNKVSTSIDLFGAAGLRLSIPKTPLALDLGVNYLLGLTKCISTSDDDRLLYNNITSEDPYTAVNKAIVYNTISGISSTEHIRSLSGALSSVKRQALRLSIGLIFKF